MLLYSFPLLKITFALVVTLFFLVVLRHLLLVPRPFAFDQVERRTDLSKRLIRPGLNVDTLPLVRIDYGKYLPESLVPGAGDEADQSINKAQIRQLCLSRGYYIGPEASNDTVNCADTCGVSERDVAYTYVTETDAGRIVAGRQKLQIGGYCMPTLMANCNRNTSSVVYGLAGWTCIPRTDAFAGEGGNRIVVCNGNLRDNALRTVYRDFIPSNLVFNDVYRDRLADNTFRFECLHKERDGNGNLYVESELNRLHRVRNWCVEDVPFASGVEMDLRKGRCLCGVDLKLNPVNGKCTACAIGFDEATKQIAFTSKPCYSWLDTVQQFEERVQNLKDQLGETTLDNATIFPCGYNAQGNASESTLPRCLTYHIVLYQPALPSHNTLQVIDSIAS